MQDAMHIIFTLEDCVERQVLDDLCRSVVYIFAEGPHALDIIRMHIDKEIKVQDHSGTLFRSNGGTSKTMTYYTHCVGLEFLYKCLHETILECIANASDTAEVDSSKLKKDEDVNLNRWTLMAATQKILLAIIRGTDTMPTQMREICQYLQHQCLVKFEDSRHTSVGGYIFLRLFCPALTSPVQFGLTKTKPNDQATRMLILISKALQNLANGIEFGGKEKHMIQINELVTQNLEKVRQYFDTISMVPENAARSPIIPMPKDVRQRALACVFQTMLSNRDTLDAALKNHPALKARFESFMENPAAEPAEMLEKKSTARNLKKGSPQIEKKDGVTVDISPDDGVQAR